MANVPCSKLERKRFLHELHPMIQYPDLQELVEGHIEDDEAKAQRLH